MANSNAGSKVYVSPTPLSVLPADNIRFNSISDWIEIKAVGSHGEAGSSTNILTYDTWDTDVIQKAKGMTDAGSPEIEVSRIANDPGQEVVRAAALTNMNYAFKMERNDGTVIFNAGLVTGPRRPFGRNEDFDLEIFTLGLNQREVVSDSSVIDNASIHVISNFAGIAPIEIDGVEYNIVNFYGSGELQISGAVPNCKIAIGGGGGAGGRSAGTASRAGGGGAGGLYVNETFGFYEGNCSLVIGAGAPSNTANNGRGANGSASSLIMPDGSSVTVPGGGGGGGNGSATGANGGSGGGGCGQATVEQGAGGIGRTGGGGGTAHLGTTTAENAGGGGGGAGGPGGDGAEGVGGVGGPGASLEHLFGVPLTVCSGGGGSGAVNGSSDEGGSDGNSGALASLGGGSGGYSGGSSGTGGGGYGFAFILVPGHVEITQ